jgi:hypothetical protein
VIVATIINPSLARLEILPRPQDDIAAERAEINAINSVNRRYDAHEKCWYLKFPRLYIEKPYMRRAFDAFDRQLDFWDLL